MEKFNQLKRDMMWAFENKQEIPESTQQVIQEMFDGLQYQYAQMGCSNSEIKEVIYQNIDNLIQNLETGIGNERKDEQFKKLQAVWKNMNTCQNYEETKYKINELSSNQPDNIRITLNTIDQIEKSLKDTQAKQNNILYKNKIFSKQEIENMNSEALKVISKLRNKNEKNVYNSFKLDNEELNNELLQAFDKYTQ